MQSKVIASRRFFFWLQETDSSKDHEIINSVNKFFGANVDPANDEAAWDALDAALGGFGFESLAETQTPESDTHTNSGHNNTQISVPVPFNVLLSQEGVREFALKPENQNELLSLLPEGYQTPEELEQVGKYEFDASVFNCLIKKKSCMYASLINYGPSFAHFATRLCLRHSFKCRYAGCRRHACLVNIMTL